VAGENEAGFPDAPSTVIASRGFRINSSKTFFCLPSDPAPMKGTNAFKRGLKRGLQDQREIYTAPFHRSALKWDAGFAVISGGLIATDKHVTGALSKEHLEVSRDVSDAGLYSMTATLGGLWLSSLVTKDPHARETGELGLEALANTAAVYGVLQVVTGRERPLEGAGKGHFWQNNSLNSSFPSAHVAFTWTTASVVAHEYPRPWVEWLAYSTAGAVSVTRVTSQKHFPADVVVGSVLGYLVGQRMFHAHCKAGLSLKCRASQAP
jgi:hypothetical protein